MVEFKSPIQNNKYYTIHLTLKSKQTNIYIYSDVDYSSGGISISVSGANLVKNFNYLLDITPQNFQNKLQTILTFL